MSNRGSSLIDFGIINKIMKKVIIVGLLIVAGVALFSLGSRLGLPQKEEAPVSNTSEKEEQDRAPERTYNRSEEPLEEDTGVKSPRIVPEGWQLYGSELAGLSFIYPSGWRLGGCVENNFFFLIKTKSVQCGVGPIPDGPHFTFLDQNTTSCSQVISESSDVSSCEIRHIGSHRVLVETHTTIDEGGTYPVGAVYFRYHFLDKTLNEFYLTINYTQFPGTTGLEGTIIKIIESLEITN